MQERRVVKCYCEKLQRKGPLSVASFSRSFLRGNRQELSARCPRLGAPKFPAVFCRTLVRRAGCLSAGASRNLSLLPPAHLGSSATSLEHGQATTWLTLLSPQSGAGPASCSPLLWLPVSASPSAPPGWFYTSAVTESPEEHPSS